MTISQLEQPLHRNEWPWPNPNIKEIDAEVLRLRAALADKDAALRDIEGFLSKQDVAGEPDTSDVWVNIGQIRAALAAVRKALKEEK